MYGKQDRRNAYTNNRGSYQAPTNYNVPSGGYAPKPKKHSGAKKIVKNGVDYISAWNYSRQKGMVTVFIAPYNKSDVVHSAGSGKKYRSLMCQIEYKNSGVSKHFPVLINIDTERVSIPEMGWVVNHRAPNGGYCGIFSKN